MSDPLPISRRFRYSAWANAEAFGALRPHWDSAPDRARSILSHMAAGELVWLDRMGYGPPVAPIPVWPDLSADECGRYQGILAEAWPAALDRIAVDGPGRQVAYANSQGQAFTSVVADILEHLLFHGAYHRGQLAILLGRAGLPTVNTDFIHWVRTGEPAPG